MRYLLFSDIHSNLEALVTCIAASPKYDLALNLGDLVGYGGSPNQVLETVRYFRGIVIRGNHDKACAGIASPGTMGFNPMATHAAQWTVQTLTDENREWLRQLPAGPMDVPRLPSGLCVHGAPADEDAYLLSIASAAGTFRETVHPLVFFGHTHIQGGYIYRRGMIEAIQPKYVSSLEEESWELPLHPEARYLINPGSIGQPRDGDWRCAFALFDSKARCVTYYRVPYPVEMAQQKILSAGLPEFLAQRLKQGR